MDAAPSPERAPSSTERAPAPSRKPTADRRPRRRPAAVARLVATGVATTGTFAMVAGLALDHADDAQAGTGTTDTTVAPTTVTSEVPARQTVIIVRRHAAPAPAAVASTGAAATPAAPSAPIVVTPQGTPAAPAATTATPSPAVTAPPAPVATVPPTTRPPAPPATSAPDTSTGGS